MSKGFIQIRRGLKEHLLAGRIGLFEAGVYLVIHLQTTFETGIWTGSAPRLLATAPRGASLRNVQRAIARLEEIDFIRVFRQHGQRGNYRVLINKYEPQSGALRGLRLNALASTSWQKPTYEPCAETDAVSVAEAAPYLKKEREKKEETTIIPLVKIKRGSIGRAERLDADSFSRLFEELKRSLSDLSRRTFDFAVGRITARAKTPPNSAAFFEKSLPTFFDPQHFVPEVQDFLTDRACLLLQESDSLASVSEDLKCAAAEYDLKYTAMLIDDALEAALTRLQREAALRTEMHSGQGPLLRSYPGAAARQGTA